jgi:hypothetical protein
MGFVTTPETAVHGTGPVVRTDAGRERHLADHAVASMPTPSPEDARLLRDLGQDNLLDLELATIDMDAREKWMVEQLLLTYVADSVPTETWCQGLAAGARAVRRDRATRSAEDVRESD